MCGEMRGCAPRTPSERMRAHLLWLYLLWLYSLTMAILTMAHVVREDAHHADLRVSVREGGPALDVGELDAELRRITYTGMKERAE